MSQNGRKMAKMLHNAAKKFDWVIITIMMTKSILVAQCKLLLSTNSILVIKKYLQLKFLTTRGKLHCKLSLV